MLFCKIKLFPDKSIVHVTYLHTLHLIVVKSEMNVIPSCVAVGDPKWLSNNIDTFVYQWQQTTLWEMLQYVTATQNQSTA